MVIGNKKYNQIWFQSHCLPGFICFFFQADIISRLVLETPWLRPRRVHCFRNPGYVGSCGGWSHVWSTGATAFHLAVYGEPPQRDPSGPSIRIALANTRFWTPWPMLVPWCCLCGRERGSTKILEYNLVSFTLRSHWRFHNKATRELKALLPAVFALMRNLLKCSKILEIEETSEVRRFASGVSSISRILEHLRRFLIRVNSSMILQNFAGFPVLCQVSEDRQLCSMCGKGTARWTSQNMWQISHVGQERQQVNITSWIWMSLMCKFNSQDILLLAWIASLRISPAIQKANLSCICGL